MMNEEEAADPWDLSTVDNGQRTDGGTRYRVDIVDVTRHMPADAL